MKLQVLGPGCPKCLELYNKTQQAADGLGIDYELEKVEDIAEIVGFGVMLTPALVVDGIVKFCGKVPPVDELKAYLQ